MKSATCQICGQLIYGRSLLMVDANQLTMSEQKQIADLQEFNSLAGQMTGHISNMHPEHAREMAAIGFLAAKVYAMTWAESITEDFGPLRKSWRTVFLQEMAKERTQATAAAPAPTASDGNSDGTGSGLYSKNSERKVST